MEVRPGEETAVQKLVTHAPVAFSAPKFSDPHTKANALLQVGGAWPQHGRCIVYHVVVCPSLVQGKRPSSVPCSSPALASPLLPASCPQAHFSRTPLGGDLALDARDVVKESVRLLQVRGASAGRGFGGGSEA